MPKQSLRRVKGCGSAALQILIAYPRWLQINSTNPFRTQHPLLRASVFVQFRTRTLPSFTQRQESKGCTWNVRARCLGQETLWHVKDISQTLARRMIHSTANLSAKLCTCHYLKRLLEHSSLASLCETEEHCCGCVIIILLEREFFMLFFGCL